MIDLSKILSPVTSSWIISIKFVVLNEILRKKIFLRDFPFSNLFAWNLESIYMYANVSNSCSLIFVKIFNTESVLSGMSNEALEKRLLICHQQ